MNDVIAVLSEIDTEAALRLCSAKTLHGDILQRRRPEATGVSKVRLGK